MGITLPLDSPFFTGVGISSLVPGKWDVALNGHTYMLDDKHEAFKQGLRTIALLRQQADSSDRPGEGSINPEELWRRAHETWHRGAGQTHYDREDSDPGRFHASKGIDPWTQWQFSLLNDTDSKRASAETNLQLAVAGDYLYVSDGNEVYWTQDATVDTPTWTSAVVQNGEVAQSVKSLASNGYTVYAALGSNGIHQTTRGAVASTHYSDLSATLLGYAKGRLMAANGNAIYNVTASGVAPSALLTHPNTDFSWVGFAEGTGHIYAAGYSGDKSLVYRTAVKADGTALDTPVVAGELPDGEIVRSIKGYLSFVLLGTDRGLRLASTDGDGNLLIGALIDLGVAVYCFEGQDRFVWFGWTNYDDDSTGLGRLDLSTFTEANVPAYASDLMATGEGTVSSVVTFGERRVFAVNGLGIYGEAGEKVAEGYLTSGQIGYGLPDVKVGMYADIRHEPLAGTVTTFVSVDSAADIRVGMNTLVGSTSPEPFPVGQESGYTFELRHVLTRSTDDTRSVPTIKRYSLRAFPSPKRGKSIWVPLLLFENVKTRGNKTGTLDVKAEYDYLAELVASPRLVTYQEGDYSWSVTIEDHQFERHSRTESGNWWNGTMVLKLKAFAE